MPSFNHLLHFRLFLLHQQQLHLLLNVSQVLQEFRLFLLLLLMLFGLLLLLLLHLLRHTQQLQGALFLLRELL